MSDVSPDTGDRLTPYPGSPYDVRPPEQTDALPAGHGALAIEAWRTPSEASDAAVQGPIIGVDGKPAAFGFGRGLVVVPAGERLVEVQEGRPRQTTQVVVAEGQVVEFEFSPGSKQAHRGPQGEGGVLGSRMARPRNRVTPWLYLAMAIVAALGTVVAIVVTSYDGVPAVGLLAALVGLYLIWVGYSGWKRGRRPNGSKTRKGDR